MTSPRPLSPEEWDAQQSHVLTPEEWDAQQQARPLPTLGRLRNPMAPRDVTATSADATTPGLAQSLRNRSIVGQIEAAPGDAADMATEMARTPVQSILGMAKATIQAPYLTGRYVGQQVLPNPNGRLHDVTGKEALAGAAMLAGPAIAPLIGAPATAALTGAAFMPDKPFAGALIGAGLEGVHRLMPKAEPVPVAAPEVPAPTPEASVPAARPLAATMDEGFANARKALEEPATPDALSALRDGERVEPAAKPTVLSPEEWNARQAEAPKPAPPTPEPTIPASEATQPVAASPEPIVKEAPAPTPEPAPVSPQEWEARQTEGPAAVPSAPDVSASPRFQKWFAGSKVVDAEGKPQVVYHGTKETFDKFDTKRTTQGIHWFTSDRGSIERGEAGAQGSGVIMDLHASLKNPAGWAEYEKYGLGELKRAGYDGAILPNKDGSFDGFVFDPKRLKKVTVATPPSVVQEMHAGLPSPAPILKAFSEAPVVAKLRDAINIIVDPAARSPEAGQTAGIIRAQTGAMARTYEQANATLEGFRAAFDKQPTGEGLALMHSVETNPAGGRVGLGKVEQALTKPLDATRDEIRALGTGKLDHFNAEYLPHIWEDPTQAASVIGQILGKRPLGGPASFLKERTIPTILDGMFPQGAPAGYERMTEPQIRAEIANQGGLVPVSFNPVELSLLKLREMQRYLMGQRVITEMKEQGLVKYVAAGSERPAGYVRLNDKVATVYGPKQGAVTLPEGANIAPEDVGVPGRRIMGEYWAPEPVARIVNNYLSPGLRGNAIYDAFRGVGNTLNQAQLGLSAFHLGFTSMDAAVSRTALGIEQMAGGKIATGAKTFASTPLAPLTNIMQGAKVRAEYLKPGTMGGDYAALAQAVADAGGRVKMDSFYRNNAPERFVEAWRQNNVGKMALNSVPAFFQTAMKPIMEYVVPRQKLGVFADLAREALSKLPENATEQMRRKVMADAWDSVDNRLGQLVYDNLFWDKTFKDLAMASVRSVGWNLGTIREIGGGIGDAARGELTHRSAYIAALPITVGLAGAVMTYLYTGRGPQSLKDYFYPPTGRFDADGNENRVQLPSYMKDVMAYKKHPWTTVKNKLNPSITVITDMLNNEDFYGDKIYNEDDPLVQRLKQSGQYFAAQFLPFTFRNLSEEQKRGDKSLAAWGSSVGITPASRETVRSDAQNLMMQLSPKGPGGATPEQAEERKAKQNILATMRRGDDPSSAVYDAMQRGIVNPKELRLLAKRAGTVPMVERFKRLPLDAAIKVFNASDDPREKEMWLPILKDKASRAIHP